MVDAIGAGYRLIDTAAAYGNEAAVGAAIKRSGCGARRFVYHHRCGFRMPVTNAPGRPSERSMQRLQLDYLDLT